MSRMLTTRFLALSAALALAAGCSSSSGSGAAQEPPEDDAGVDGGVVKAAGDPVDVPIDGIPSAQVATFDNGDAIFELPLREADGLGPLYVRPACGACHASAARGPGLVQKMSVVETDGITASADQSELPYGHSIRPLLTAGATTPVEPPSDPNIKLSTRVGPPVMGRGYIEAIDDAEIQRVQGEQAQRSDAIHGQINLVTFASVANTDATFDAHQQGETNIIGRFGLKARVATLDDFVADAFQNDMGITSPMRPTELANPDGLTDDAKPGVDVGIDTVNTIAFYLRMIAIPRRDAPADGATALFDQAKCSVCHVPSLHTRADYPIALLADIDAPVYSDILLHDMGDALADGMVDQSATSRQFRTAPLIGLRFDHSFLHDGRVSTVDAAIRAHAGEALESANLYGALSAADQQTLLTFVESL
jgi:CxxC motif-containing protein (DUF1111 family)